jgi:hypothetical protein
LAKQSTLWIFPNDAGLLETFLQLHLTWYEESQLHSAICGFSPTAEHSHLCVY